MEDSDRERRPPSDEDYTPPKKAAEAEPSTPRRSRRRAIHAPGAPMRPQSHGILAVREYRIKYLNPVGSNVETTILGGIAVDTDPVEVVRLIHEAADKQCGGRGAAILEVERLHSKRLLPTEPGTVEYIACAHAGETVHDLAFKMLLYPSNLCKAERIYAPESETTDQAISRIAPLLGFPPERIRLFEL